MFYICYLCVIYIIFLSTSFCKCITIFIFENKLYTISIDLFRIDCCVILYLYDMNMLEMKIELAIYIKIY